jgi:hypothetical protein
MKNHLFITVQDYHQIAEECQANRMVRADLLRKRIVVRRWRTDIVRVTGFNGYFIKTNPECIVGKLAIILKRVR